LTKTSNRYSILDTVRYSSSEQSWWFDRLSRLSTERPVYSPFSVHSSAFDTCRASDIQHRRRLWPLLESDQPSTDRPTDRIQAMISALAIADYVNESGGKRKESGSGGATSEQSRVSTGFRLRADIERPRSGSTPVIPLPRQVSPPRFRARACLPSVYRPSRPVVPQPRVWLVYV